jgi:flavodoxin
MKTLVLYDSQFGNTERIAVKIAGTLREFGDAQAARVTAIDPATALQGIDLLIVGCPTQAWNATGTMKKVLAELARHPDDPLYAAEFDTRFDKPRWLTGSAARRLEKELTRLDVIHLLEPESFFVQDSEGPLADGELEHAARWANALYQEYERLAKPQMVMA